MNFSYSGSKSSVIFFLTVLHKNNWFSWWQSSGRIRILESFIDQRMILVLRRLHSSSKLSFYLIGHPLLRGLWAQYQVLEIQRCKTSWPPQEVNKHCPNWLCRLKMYKMRNGRVKQACCSCSQAGTITMGSLTLGGGLELGLKENWTQSRTSEATLTTRWVKTIALYSLTVQS